MSVEIQFLVDLINDASIVLDHIDVTAFLDMNLILIFVYVLEYTEDAEVILIVYVHVYALYYFNAISEIVILVMRISPNVCILF